MRIFILSVLLLNLVICRAQSLDELFKQSTQAYNDKKFDQFLILMRQLDSMRPSHPRITYNLASAYALNHQAENSISTLKELVLMNNTVKFEMDSDFVSLKTIKAYPELILLKKDLGKTIAGSEKIVELNEIDLHPEAILYMPKHKTWLVTSIRKNKIVSFDLKTGKCEDWLTNADLLAVFSIKSDAEEQFLWAATSAIPEMINYSPNAKGKAIVLQIDIESKKVVQQYILMGDHTLGDLIVSKKGDVYISDSNEPIIYKIEKGKSDIKEWCNLQSEAFNLQGLTFNENET